MSYKLTIPSDWTNLINTIIFEFVLLSLIFQLTADVCARLNYLALVDGSVKELVVVSPPLVGGGLISTSRARSMFMIAFRGIGIFLIFGTALTIDGESDTKKVITRKMVRTAADVPANTTLKQFQDLIDLRRSCTTFENNTIVYGRLDNTGYCETNLLLLERPIRIRYEPTPTDVLFSSGCRHNDTLAAEFEDGSQMRKVATTCDQNNQQASILCSRMIDNASNILMNACYGLFKLSGSKWFVCEDFVENFADPSISMNTLCHAAENIDEVQYRWLELVSILNETDHFPIVDMIGAVSVIGIKSRAVPSFEQRDVTSVHETWLLCLMVKLLLVVSLGLVSIWLRMQSAKPVLNDCCALLGLLRQKLNDWVGAEPNDEKQLIYLRTQTSNDGTRKVWASILPDYNPRNFVAEEET